MGLVTVGKDAGMSARATLAMTKNWLTVAGKPSQTASHFVNHCFPSAVLDDGAERFSRLEAA